MKAILNENLFKIVDGYIVVTESPTDEWNLLFDIRNNKLYQGIVATNDPYTKKVLLTIGFKINKDAFEFPCKVPYADLEDMIDIKTWNKPCLSRKDVQELFHIVFKKEYPSGEFVWDIESGKYKLSVSKNVSEFDKQLKEFSKNKLIKKDKSPKLIKEIEFETDFHFVEDPICVEEWEEIKTIKDPEHEAGRAIIKNIKYKRNERLIRAI